MAINKVLTFRPGSIGDCLMAKYFLEQVHAAYPHARCAIAVPLRGKMVRDLLQGYPWIEGIEVNRKSPKALWYLLRQFWRSDLVMTPYTGGTFPLHSKLIARLLGRTLVGYSDAAAINALLYTSVVSLTGRMRAPRLLECDALAVANIPVAFKQPSFAYVSQPELLSRLGLTQHGYVVLHMFSGSDARGISPQNRRKLIEVLAKALPADMRIVVTGSQKERGSLGDDLPKHVVLAETTLQELAQLIDHAKTMVSLDTGAAHLAAHLKKPLVVLASCVGVQWWSKDMYGEKIPAALYTCGNVCAHGHDRSGYAPCLEAIDFAEVAKRTATLCT